MTKGNQHQHSSKRCSALDDELIARFVLWLPMLIKSIDVAYLKLQQQECIRMILFV